MAGLAFFVAAGDAGFSMARSSSQKAMIRSLPYWNDKNRCQSVRGSANADAVQSAWKVNLRGAHPAPGCGGLVPVPFPGRLRGADSKYRCDSMGGSGE